MLKEEFLKKAKRKIYESATIAVNNCISGNKVSAAAIGLYLNLPIQVELRKLPKTDKIKLSYAKLATNVSAYLKHDDSTKVVFAFYYENDRQISKLSKFLDKDKIGEYFAYLYLRETFRVTLGHNTHAYYKVIKQKLAKTSVPVDNYLAISNASSHYFVNSVLSKVLGKFSTKLDKILESQLFTSSYEGMTTFVILDCLVNTNFSMKPLCEEEEFDGIYLYGGAPHLVYKNSPEEYDEHIVDLGETLELAIRSFSMGTASEEIFAKTFAATKVKTGWFKKIQNMFSRSVYYKTETCTSSWSSLNSTYRHKFKAPTQKFESKSISAILTIDQSGSQNLEDLGKLLYIFQKQAKRISYLHVIIYDTEIVKEQVFSSTTSLENNKELLDMLSTRYTTGGTDFTKVARRIEELNLDPEMTIHISLSDNCQDYESAVKDFPIMNQIENYWLCTIPNHPVPKTVRGTNIQLV